MSIEFSLKVKDNIVNENLLINEINKLGVNAYVDKINEEEDRFEIDSIHEPLGFSVIFIKNKKPPYNTWETKFLETDFQYNQIVWFEFDKEADLSITQRNALKIIFNLMKQLNTSALLTSSVYDDICYFKNATDVYINKDVACLEKVRDMALYDNNWRCFYS
ncbi:hypothetical protein [Clostridium lundense]|uniref:hypothetical protein n=1 Tax=Clostridium lundense TaxID=319475 RepID=UPI0006852514|nr:hypothetical protein [Clostridium lundense]